MNSDFPRIYMSKLQPLHQSDDDNQIQQEINNASKENMKILNGIQQVLNQNSKQQDQEISLIDQQLNKNHTNTRMQGDDEEKSRQSIQEDKENTFEKTQIMVFQGFDGDSIVEDDISKNYLQYSKNVIVQTNDNNLKKNTFQNLDEMQINDANYTQNKINDDEKGEQDQVKADETQKYIENTFKNLIASQKQHLQQQLQEKQQQISHENYEPPQCRICLEVQEEDDNFNKHSQVIFQNFTLAHNIEQAEGKNTHLKLQNGPLMSPCKCSGSSKYIHEKCLKEWIKQTYSDFSLAQCEVCKQSYVQRFQFEKKFNCSLTFFCSNPKKKITGFFLWLLLIHFFVITLILILVDIFQSNQDSHFFIKSQSNTAEYILITVDFILIAACLIIFKKYFISLFKTKKLIDWQIMNFTKHPKEKHPKLIEKYYEGRPSKDANSASNRNLQLQLMMNNSIDNHNKANSVHNATHGQSLVLNQSQIGKPNNSIFNSQKMQRNNSNYLQTVNFFANMGVSENILNDYINNQELGLDDQQLPIKGQSSLVIKKCSSQEDGNQENILNNQDQKLIKQSSLKLRIPSPINNQLQNITASEKLTTRKESNNFLNLPFDERSPDKLNGFSTNFGKAEDKSSRKGANSQWQRHIFFAKDQSYEIIVKPSENQDDMKEETNVQLSKINNQENNPVFKKYSKNDKSLQRFFESTLESSNQEKSNTENQIQKKTDNQIQMYGEEVVNKAQLIQDKKQLFRVCESIESSSDEKIDLKKQNNESVKDNQVQQQEKKQVFTDQIQIKKQIPKTIKQTTSQQRLQNILYEKIQKQNPYISQEILSNQNQLNQNSNLSKQNSKENPGQGQLFSSLNTQAQTQGVGDSQKTQINNKSFLSQNNVSIQKGLSTVKSNDSFKVKANISHNQTSEYISNQATYQKESNHQPIQAQTIETQESGIQKNCQNKHKDSQNDLKIKQIINQLNKEDMHVESLDI
ncbi:hypothetical protein ABPG74_008947 [Tetrahymena malaccensis]